MNHGNVKILGVQRVAIYNISCGPAIEKVLKHYVNEGTMEVIAWNIHDYLKPSKGYLPKAHGGDLHYHVKLVTLNECLNRYMKLFSKKLYQFGKKMVLMWKIKALKLQISI